MSNYSHLVFNCISTINDGVAKCTNIALSTIGQVSIDFAFNSITSALYHNNFSNRRKKQRLAFARGGATIHIQIKRALI